LDQPAQPDGEAVTYLVKRADGLYLMGMGGWHRQRSEAFRFTDNCGRPSPRHWAKEVVDHWNAQQGHIPERRARVVRLVPRGGEAKVKP